MLRPTLFAALACLLMLTLAARAAMAATISVSTTSQLTNAINSVSPGDTIELAAGASFNYAGVTRLTCDVDGTASNPITVRGLPGSTMTWTHSSNYVEGFVVTGKHWIFEDLDITGTCSNHNYCEHAFHVQGDADFFVMRRCVIKNFNAQIKSNIGGGQFPDDCLLEHNEFYNTGGRQTSAPVTPANIDGGERWIVRNNYFHDAWKDGGNTISYQTFMKSNGADGIYEGNLIACSVLHSGGVRIGMSFGGGGTSPDSVCGQGTCNPEHRRGIMRNNVIINCAAIGIYLNEAQDTKIYNNILYNTDGIDVRFATSTADIRNNIIAGGDISDRDGGSSTSGSNWLTSTAVAASAFVDAAGGDFRLSGDSSQRSNFINAGVSLSQVTNDFCRRSRSSPHDIGAVDYSQGACDTSNPLAVTGPTGGAGAQQGASVQSKSTPVMSPTATYVTVAGSGFALIAVAVIALAVLVRSRRRRARAAAARDSDAAALELVAWGIAPTDAMPESEGKAPTLPPPAAPSLPPPPAPATVATHRTLLYAFAGTAADELACAAGDQVEVLEEFDDGWCSARNIATGATGALPLNYLQ